MVVDRLVLKPGLDTRYADSLEQALRLADGIAVAEWADAAEGEEAQRLIFSEKFACPVSGLFHRRDRAADCSRSTTPPAPVRPVTASASSSASIPT